MTFPLFPEYVTVRQLDALNRDPDAPTHDYRECRDHGFEGDVEIIQTILFGHGWEEWRCPGIDGEDSHDVREDIDLTDPDAGRDEFDA